MEDHILKELEDGCITITETCYKNMAIIKDRLLSNILESYYHYVFRINELHVVATTSNKHQ